MTKYSPEVLIYLNQVKEFLQKNKEADEYLVGAMDREEFFEKVLELSQTNFEKNGETMLTKEQFEEIRETAKKTKPQDYPNGVFMEIPNFGMISLN